MNHPFRSALLCLAALTLPIASTFAQDAPLSKETARLITATEVLQEQQSTPDQRVPDWLLQRAYGVAVIPDVIKGAFLFGGRFGNGVLSVRTASGRFSDPIFITLAGGSVGWQIGASSTDVVLVFMTQRSVQHFANGKFTLGVDASVAAGPVGRQGEAQGGINAEIYSYSRSRGLFAGVALDGTVLAYDRGANRAFYNRYQVDSAMITSGQVTTDSAAARRFVAAVASSAGQSAQATTTQPTAPAYPPAAAAPAPTTGTQAFPLPDAHPGAEPAPQ